MQKPSALSCALPTAATQEEPQPQKQPEVKPEKQSETQSEKQPEAHPEKKLAKDSQKNQPLSRSAFVAQAGVIAALYAAATLVALLLLQGLAWGPVQFRVSEAVCVAALLTPAAVPGLTVGCVVANLIALVINGTGFLGLFDVVFGSLATCAGAAWCYKMRRLPKIALLGPVIANALIVPAYLPIVLSGMGFYTIPFTNISLEGAYLFMYLFGVVSTGIGEALVMYVLGLPLYSALAQFGVAGTGGKQTVRVARARRKN